MNQNVEHLRHSLAHILAAAILKKYPSAKLGIGPAVENGFYYDFLLPKKINEDDLQEIQKEMRRIIGCNLPFGGAEVSAAEAKKLFKDQPFKLDLIREFVREKRPLTVYRTGEAFFDLCRGGHVDNTKEIDPNAFALTKIAGAYWRGDEKNQMLTRVYGVAFADQKEFDEYQSMLKEAEKRDHRELGRKLGIFVFSDLVGPGLPLYKPAGAFILRKIGEYSAQLRREMGYEEVHTPQINKAELFKLSGHYEKYRDDMFRVASHYTGEEYFLKPMNCPQHTQIYASEPRSYQDLPVRLADFANLYRDEKPGELGGLSRLRAFSQDDGHCFCMEDQIESEVSLLLDAIEKTMKRYGMTYWIRLSLRDEAHKEKYLGNDAVWKKSQKILRDLLEKKNVSFKPVEGEAAFYGPKMDLMARDSLGREWQLSTIQLDFNMPQRFSLTYTGKDGKKHTPVMIHSALVGSRERFLGVLIEHFAGAFPVWLAPLQVAVVPIAEAHGAYAEKVAHTLRAHGVRATILASSETLGKRIREGATRKIPYLLVVGDKEQQNESVSVRMAGGGETAVVPLKKFASQITKEAEA